MISKIQNFIHELQESDREIKKRWLVGLTAATSLVVVATWIVYVSFSIKDLRESDLSNSQSSFSEVFFNGFNMIKNEAVAKLQALGSQMEFLGLTGANLNFVAEGLEEVQPKKLINN